MELVAENGFIVSIPQGCKKELGRGSELAICDKTVSRHQILLELQERNKEASLVDHDTSLCGLSVKVLGANPVCIVHISGRSKGRRSDDQEMILLKKGETYTLSPGDKISLSITLPMFFTVREGEGRKNIASSKTMERPDSSAAVPMEEEILASAEGSKKLAEDDLLGQWKDRKKKKEAGLRITHDGKAPTDAFETRCVSADKGIATNEEEAGIAQAVARRQRRALERRLHQEQKLQDEDPRPVKEAEDVSNVHQRRALECRQQQEQKLQDAVPAPVKEAKDASNVYHKDEELEDGFVKTENIDPVKEFGFLVEGSEFEQYKKPHKPGGRWLWPPAKPPAESISDEDDENEQERHPRSRRRKARTEEEDEEWTGDDEEEVVAVASAKKYKAHAKVNLRSHEPSSSKKRMRKSEETEDEDEEDEADETLGGFIVNDEKEEEPIDDDAGDEEEEEPIDDDADDEEEEISNDEMDDAEEEENDEDEQQQNKKRENKREEKPLCKFGKNCYRKNPDHLAQFRH